MRRDGAIVMIIYITHNICVGCGETILDEIWLILLTPGATILPFPN
jgi:hypothetical protein